jgi:hypothetical protein
MVATHKLVKQALAHFPKRPVRPYSSFDDFCHKKRRFSYGKHPYYCFHCGGSGIVIAPNERPDPVEGYKMADRVPCLVCRGTGQVDKKAWQSVYREEMARWRNGLDRWRMQDALRRQALLELSDDEIKALKLA